MFCEDDFVDFNVRTVFYLNYYEGKNTHSSPAPENSSGCPEENC